ncbi:hypothetical protein ACSTDE_05530 [Enterobacter hormaechei]|uniref:hypothetical protein n=1 Tax=Enterobacter hormaechei TaxID=158836 RepID=UPI0013777571|nr:hypothetical protein [Enterobacter hormaechei]NBF28304.1 hypothetical protein [Enterobacter hormaechei]
MTYLLWESWEEDFLREVAATMEPKLIAEKLERSEMSIWSKAGRLGLKLISSDSKPWSETELALFSTHTPNEIAEVTSRSIYSVRAKLLRLPS